MLTANHLRQGDVLYWKAGAWVEDLNQGEVFADPKAADTALAEAQAFVTANKVVAPYLFEVTRLDDGKIRPVKERELNRSLSNSVHPDTRKQASQNG